MDKLTPLQVSAGTGADIGVAMMWTPLLQTACDAYQINTKLRYAAFLSQIGVESAGLMRLVESLNYAEDALKRTWPNRVTADFAARYGRNASHPADQAAIANLVYANRGGNGDSASGDGWKYRGRGLIQITMKSNYEQVGKAIGLPLVDNPDLLCGKAAAALSAAYFFSSRGCNAFADVNDITSISAIINCGNARIDPSKIMALARRKSLFQAAQL